MQKFIVYACPVGELASQLELYFQTSEIECGKNAAHKYMPHCTLTGFFEDELMAIPIYIKALNNSLSKYSTPVINVLNMTFKPEWHGLELHSPMLKKLIFDFDAYSAFQLSAIHKKNPLPSPSGGERILLVGKIAVVFFSGINS